MNFKRISKKELTAILKVAKRMERNRLNLSQDLASQAIVRRVKHTRNRHINLFLSEFGMISDFFWAEIQNVRLLCSIIFT